MDAAAACVTTVLSGARQAPQFAYPSYRWTTLKAQVFLGASADLGRVGEAGRLAASGDVPVLVVTTQSFVLQRRATDGEPIDGPHRLS